MSEPKKIYFLVNFMFDSHLYEIDVSDYIAYRLTHTQFDSVGLFMHLCDKKKLKMNGDNKNGGEHEVINIVKLLEEGEENLVFKIYL